MSNSQSTEVHSVTTSPAPRVVLLGEVRSMCEVLLVSITAGSSETLRADSAAGSTQTRLTPQTRRLPTVSSKEITPMEEEAWQCRISNQRCRLLTARSAKT